MYDGEIPFDQYGAPMPFVRSWEHDKAIWRPNAPFQGHLVFKDFRRGRSAAHAVFDHIDEGHEVQVFLADLAVMIRSAAWLHGGIVAEFVYVKRGQNYGVALA